MNRRNLLKLMGVGAVSPMLLQKAVANNFENSTHLLVIDLPGGWDTTLSLDPWIGASSPDENDLFLGYKKSAVLKRNNLYLGPSLHPLQKYSKEMSIVNGIFLSEVDNGHDAAKKYMLTGSVKSHNAMTLNFEGASHVTSGLGVISNTEVFRGDSSVTSSSVDGVRNAYSNNLTGERLKGFSSLQLHRTALTDAIKNMVGNSANMKNLFKYLNESNFDDESGIIQEALIIASAFRAKSARFAELSISSQNGNLDTHSNHEGSHEKTLKDTFKVLSKVLDLFKSIPYDNLGNSLFDKTTIMVTSEFSRTAALNNAKGKDHNPMTNSALFFGSGIRGGEVIGGSKLITREKSLVGMPYQIAKPYDFDAGTVMNERAAQADFITPEVLSRTLCSALKIDPSKVDGVNEDSRVLKKLLK